MTRLKFLSIVFIITVLAITRPDQVIIDYLTPLTSLERGSALVKKNWRRIVKITPVDNEHSGGTGFAVKTAKGKTVTVSNAHVCAVADNGKVAARWDNGRYTILDVLEVDEKHDLCLMSGLPGEIEGFDLAWQDVDINDPIYVIGHPLLYPNTYSEGLVRERLGLFLTLIIAPKDREECESQKLEYREYKSLFGTVAVCGQTFDSFGTSVRIMPGNSGSPVFNFKGEVVGVVFAGDTRTGDGSYVPLEYLERLLASY